jgi:hypothetical protein
VRCDHEVEFFPYLQKVFPGSCWFLVVVSCGVEFEVAGMSLNSVFGSFQESGIELFKKLFQNLSRGIKKKSPA